VARRTSREALLLLWNGRLLMVVTSLFFAHGDAAVIP
jgi:hypothetical protein